MEEEEEEKVRFYEAKFPDVDELVVVQVKQIAEMGAYVTLLEYGGIEGMILFSELSRRRVRSITKLVRVGRIEVVQVLRVDPDKGYIDLSKRRVDADDIQVAEARFNQAKAVQSIMRHASERLNRDMYTLLSTVSWPLYSKYGHAYEGFLVTMHSPERVWEELPTPPDPELQEFLMSEIKQRLKPQPVRLRTDVHATCFAYDGVDAIRRALIKGREAAVAVFPELESSIRASLVAAPLYVLSATVEDRKPGIEALQAGIDAMKTELEAAGGELVLKEAPRIVSNKDDKLLRSTLETLNEGEEGDEDDDDEDNDED